MKYWIHPESDSVFASDDILNAEQCDEVSVFQYLKLKQYINMEKIIIFKETITQGFTQSEIDTWDTCAYKWYLRYNLGLMGGESIALIFGTAWHLGLKQMYETKGKKWSVPVMKFEEPNHTTEEESKLERYQYMLEAMLLAYSKHYADDFDLFDYDPAEDIEKLVDIVIDFNGVKIRLKGILDLIPEIKGRGVIMDHKSAAALNFGTISGWDFKFQFLFYAWLCHKIWPKRIKRFTVSGVKKPMFKVKQGEPLVAYGRRIEQDMLANPDKYFYRNTIALVKDTLSNFEENILGPKLHRIALISNPKTSQETLQLLTQNKNTNACFNYSESCAYYNVCVNGLTSEIHNYERTNEKHPHHEQKE